MNYNATPEDKFKAIMHDMVNYSKQESNCLVF